MAEACTSLCPTFCRTRLIHLQSHSREPMSAIAQPLCFVPSVRIPSPLHRTGLRDVDAPLKTLYATGGCGCSVITSLIKSSASGVMVRFEGFSEVARCFKPPNPLLGILRPQHALFRSPPPGRTQTRLLGSRVFVGWP